MTALTSTFRCFSETADKVYLRLITDDNSN